MLKAVIIATLCAVSFAQHDKISEDFQKLQATKVHIKTSSRQSSQDCWENAHLHITGKAASLLQHHNVPGAGVEKFKPFEKVLKDGFLLVDCVKDYMYYRGDKFGDNKHDYKLGPVTNVSIVHYDAFMTRKHRAKMTQTECFEFCRTVPNMGFFGIVNGRGCYCTPYFTPQASDSTQCDAVCEGDKTLMCGGKSKSSIFAMHMCDSTKDDLSTRSGTASSLAADMGAKVKVANGLSGDLQDGGAMMQKAFGAVGDSGAANLAQAMKVFAGKLEHQAEDADAAAKKLSGLAKDASGLKDFTDPATVTKAERIMEGIDESVAAGEAVTDELDKLIALADHADVKAGAAKQYYPVMYFVDKEFDDVPSTCTGDMVAQPLVGSADACASACDSHIHSCVGFQFFKGKKSGCVLFSNFKTGFYYTGCGKAFLQTKAAPFGATCYAKLSKFEGTTLKPNPSGKCKQCFTDLTKADRCY